MGVHDYICFVQGNGQTLLNFCAAPPYDRIGVRQLAQDRSTFLSLLPSELIAAVIQYPEEEQEYDWGAPHDHSIDVFRQLLACGNRDELDQRITSWVRSFGSGSAVVVLIPRGQATEAEIKKMPLPAFAKFESFVLGYDFDLWQFDITGWDTSRGAVWTSPAHPGYWLVTFQQRFHPNQIPYTYLWSIFDNRGLDIAALFPSLDRTAIVQHLLTNGIPADART